MYYAGETQLVAGDATVVLFYLIVRLMCISNSIKMTDMHTGMLIKWKWVNLQNLACAMSSMLDLSRTRPVTGCAHVND